MSIVSTIGITTVQVLTLMSSEKPVVVIDNGGYILKAGFACDNHPVAMFRTVVGRPKYLNGGYGREPYDVYIGDDAIERIDDLELNSPIVNGKIVHWDNMERIWHHIFYRELKAAPEDRAVILASSINATMQEKIKCCEIFFETLNTPGLCVQSQAVLALYGSGRTTGMSLDLGYDTTDVCPVYEGGLIKYAHMQNNYASSDISNFIKHSLSDRKYDLGNQTHDILEDIKKLLYITQDVAMSRKHHKRYYTLPSGEQIEVGQEAFMAAEMMFQPELVKSQGTNVTSLQDTIITSALKCDPDLRQELFDAIVPSGGMSMIPGLNTRLAAELEAALHRPVNVLSSSEAYAVSWLGGATFAGMSDAKKVWVTKKQYEDYGARIIKNKFM